MDNHKANILIVDDTIANMRLLVDLLGNQGYLVRPALSGNMALKAAEKEAPDLVLLDILMPEMDGYEVCRILKADDKLKDVPVIFISALDDVSDKVKGFSVGGVDYISKPFQIEEVLARVETHLTLRRLRQELEEKNIHLKRMNSELSKSLDEIETLREILPICCNCKKIRDDEGYWQQLEAYFKENSGIEFSHGICPKCAKELYPDLYEDK
ncbi:MAG: response regulator [Desulfamplus sp.]|nr:response regulator [Desulfamplus sp.]